MAKFCFECGTALAVVEIENHQRLQCPVCQWIFYPQLKVGAAALIVQPDGVLLARRAHAPWRGFWYLPAGYVDADESPEAAVQREVLEETGLRVTVENLAGIYYFDDDPRGNGILLVYNCAVIGGVLSTSVETDSVRFFSSDQMPEQIAGAGHADAIREWLGKIQQVQN